MTADYYAVIVILVVAASAVTVFLLALRDMRRELKRLEKVFPVAEEAGDDS